MLNVIDTIGGWLATLLLEPLQTNEVGFFVGKPTDVADADICVVYVMLQELVTKRIDNGTLFKKPDYTILGIDCENSDFKAEKLFIAGGFDV